VLFPAAILILFGLGALALDSATVFLGQRRLVDLATAVAGDAIAAVDLQRFYAQEPGQELVPLDHGRAQARLEQLVAGHVDDASLAGVACTLSVDDGPPARAEATCSGVATPILAPLLPGSPRVRPLQVTEVAVGVQRGARSP
jgi:hypothetical protein